HDGQFLVKRNQLTFGTVLALLKSKHQNNFLRSFSSLKSILLFFPNLFIKKRHYSAKNQQRLL
ncbi:hypothetical protein AN404_09475, partial [Pediococcus acidilactici]